MSSPFPKIKVYVIGARTGCTCCSDQNHYRGLFKTREEAEKRKSYYLAKDSKYWPLASQYAPRGRYSVSEFEVEVLPDGRFIVDTRVLAVPKFITVGEDGSVENNEDERIYDLDYYY